MNKTTSLIDALIREGDFTGLFIEELGWDQPKIKPIEIKLDGDTFVFEPVAEKQGFNVLATERTADHRTRQRLHRVISQRTAEHFAIYGTGGGSQHWQWTELRSGRPPRLVTHEWHPDRENVALVERLAAIKFQLAEEGNLNLLGVRRRVGAAFSADKVSGRFYKDFQDEHRHLLHQIKGIDVLEDLEWYGSVLLNRLMFLYFIQKRGYLDGDPNYLRSRFEAVQSARGKGHFFTFFRQFLLPLFHDALGRKRPELEDAELAALVGDVPYINGGFFSIHELEHSYDIDVSDDAFDRVFTLFDSYRWHLSEIPEHEERAINPDVLGYVFERYINQKEKGAYYTKTDVTGFMVRSAVLPVFLDRWQALADTTDVVHPRWELLAETPQLYVPDGLGHGIGAEIPNSFWAEREQWPTPPWLLEDPPEDVALPAETWLESMDRLERHEALISRLGSGALSTATEAITANIAIARFAVDAVLDISDLRTALAVLDLLQALRIVDPACGSGAFLFAALNVLEELYEATITVLRDLPPEEDHELEARRQAQLAEIDAHASTEYFIAKSAALHNLFGVDLMHEAVEIAKLRLFLKLVAGLRDRDELEPLPDLDLNLRAGNTVVGYVSAKDAMESLAGSILAGIDPAAIEAGCSELVDLYDRFVEIQTAREVDDAGAADAKLAVLEAEGRLAAEIDRALARERGISEQDHDAWWEEEHPFHWFLEFGGVMRGGGFDCVVGNPPYRKLSDVRKEYAVEGFATDACPDLYAPMTERAAALLTADGRMAFIVPLSLTFSQGFGDLREYLSSRFAHKWISSYGRNPTALFDGKIGVRPTIFIGAQGEDDRLWTTRTHRWVEDYRPALFDTLRYVEAPEALRADEWPKLPSEDVARLMTELLTSGRAPLAAAVRHAGTHTLGYRKTALYVVSAYRTEPPCWDAKGKPIPQKEAGWLRFEDGTARDAAFLLATSKLMFLWWNVWGDDFHVTAGILDSFPLGLDDLDTPTTEWIHRLADLLDEKMQEHIDITPYNGMRIGNYRLDAVRDLTDEADELLSDWLGTREHMGAVELSFRQFAKKTGERPGVTAHVE